MKIKRFLSLALSACMFASMSFTCLAAPKQMPDGTMFDAEFYAQTYPDVASAVGTSEEALYNHYVQSGKAEGRKATADGAGSVSAQPAAQAGANILTKLSKSDVDLLMTRIYKGPAQAGLPIEKALHYAYWKEGGLFDEVRYAQMYPDIAAKVGTSHDALWKHYKTTGIYEGRQGFTNNNWGIEPSDSESLGMAMILNYVIANCNTNMPEREICKIGHDYVCSKITYGGYLFESGCKAIARGYGDCDCYAKSLAFFLQCAGLDASLFGDGQHAWTTVKIHGVEYKIDATWDDKDSGIVYYYFLVK